MTMQAFSPLSQYEREVCEALRPFGEPERACEAKNDKTSQLAFLIVHKRAD